MIDIPILGEDLGSEMNRRVDAYNKVLNAVAAENGATVLPFHDALVRLLAGGRCPPPYANKAWPMIKAAFEGLVLHHSWDRVAAGNGLSVLADHVHLSDRAAALLADLVADFLDGEHLPVRSEP